MAERRPVQQQSKSGKEQAADLMAGQLMRLCKHMCFGPETSPEVSAQLVAMWRQQAILAALWPVFAIGAADDPITRAELWDAVQDELRGAWEHLSKLRSTTTDEA